MSKYLNPKADLTFKKVFGEHKDLLISLLNSLLPLPVGREIVSVEYLTSEMIPENPGKKNSIVDVRCTETNGRQFIVEMQMYWTRDFMQRALFNTCKAYSRKPEKGVEYAEIKPVYTLCLVDDIAFKDQEDFYFDYVLTDRSHTYMTIEGIEIILVELPKFMNYKGDREEKFPSRGEMRRLAVLWMRFLTEINEETEEAPAELMANEHIAQALEIVRSSCYTDAEMEQMDKYWDAVMCERTLIKGSFREGVEKGEAIGRAEGRAEGEINKATAIAQQMKSDGLPIDIIVKYTGLTAEEIITL